HLLNRREYLGERPVGVQFQQLIRFDRGTVAKEHCRDFTACLRADQVARCLTQFVETEQAKIGIGVLDLIGETKPTLGNLKIRVVPFGWHIVSAAVAVYQKRGGLLSQEHAGPLPKPPFNRLHRFRPELKLAIDSCLMALTENPTISGAAMVANLALMRMLL